MGKAKRHISTRKKRETRLQKKERIPWDISRGFKLLVNYAPTTVKPIDLKKKTSYFNEREAATITIIRKFTSVKYESYLGNISHI